MGLVGYESGGQVPKLQRQLLSSLQARAELELAGVRRCSMMVLISLMRETKVILSHCTALLGSRTNGRWIALSRLHHLLPLRTVNALARTFTASDMGRQYAGYGKVELYVTFPLYSRT